MGCQNMHIKNDFRLKIQSYFEGTETLLSGAMQPARHE